MASPSRPGPDDRRVLYAKLIFTLAVFIGSGRRASRLVWNLDGCESNVWKSRQPRLVWKYDRCEQVSDSCATRLVWNFDRCASLWFDQLWQVRNSRILIWSDSHAYRLVWKFDRCETLWFDLILTVTPTDWSDNWIDAKRISSSHVNRLVWNFDETPWFLPLLTIADHKSDYLILLRVVIVFFVDFSKIHYPCSVSLECTIALLNATLLISPSQPRVRVHSIVLFCFQRFYEGT